MELQHYLSTLRDRWIFALIVAALALFGITRFTTLQGPQCQAASRLVIQTGSATPATEHNLGANFASQQIITAAHGATTPLVLDPVIQGRSR